MSASTELTNGSVRRNLPLILGIVFATLFLLYFVFPGFVIGLLFRLDVIGRFGSESHLVAMYIFCLPFIAADHFSFINDFYEWQAGLINP